MNDCDVHDECQVLDGFVVWLYRVWQYWNNSHHSAVSSSSSGLPLPLLLLERRIVPRRVSDFLPR